MSPLTLGGFLSNLYRAIPLENTNFDNLLIRGYVQVKSTFFFPTIDMIYLVRQQPATLAARNFTIANPIDLALSTTVPSGFKPEDEDKVSLAQLDTVDFALGRFVTSQMNDASEAETLLRKAGMRGTALLKNLRASLSKLSHPENAVILKHMSDVLAAGMARVDAESFNHVKEQLEIVALTWRTPKLSGK